MKLKLFALLAATALSAAASFGVTPAANHLLISEAGIYARSGFSNAPISAEYTEIYNPTAAAISLDNYYLSDYNLYFNLPSIVSKQASNTLANGSDFMLQFPPGFTIPSGGTVVVTCNGTSFTQAYMDNDINNFKNQPGHPQLFEIWNSNPDIPDMYNYNLDSADYHLPRPDGDTSVIADNASNMSHTDAGENIILFYWDGASSLVKDVDMVEYLPEGVTWAGGDANAIANKSNFGEQGPPPVLPASYAVDAGNPDILDIKYVAGNVGHIERRSILEPGETHTGGNGITGDDESMELGNLTWVMMRGEPTNSSPGVTSLGLSSQNQPPVVGTSSRDIQRPTPGQTVTVTCPIYDDGTFTAQLMVNKGSGYTATTMSSAGGDTYSGTITGLTEGMHVQWYVQAKDSGNLTRSEADYQQSGSSFRGYHEFMVKSTPLTSSDLIVTELVADPRGYDDFTSSYFVEVYNPASTPLNVGSFVMGTRYMLTHPTPTNKIVATVPAGTIIPAHGYLVFAGNKALFMSTYPGIDASKVVDWEIEPKSSLMAHAGEPIYFFDSNVFDFSPATDPKTESDFIASAFKVLTYDDAAPWPDGTTVNNLGYSIELKNYPPTPGSDENGSNWAKSVLIDGTPLNRNSVTYPGDVTVLDAQRDIEYPSSSQQVTISAATSSSVAIASAQVFVSNGTNTYTPVNMSSTDGTTYTAQIGPFPDQTVVKYYVVATDTSGNVGMYPPYAPTKLCYYTVQNTPVTDQDIIVNELMYDPLGSDNATMPEFIELYNRRSTPVNLSFWQYMNSMTSAYIRNIPEGTIIPGNGYLVIGCTKEYFDDQYVSPFNGYYNDRNGKINPDMVIDAAWQPTSFLANSGAPAVFLVNANAVDWNGLPSVPTFELDYTNAAPWPNVGQNPDTQAWIAVNGPSIEL